VRTGLPRFAALAAVALLAACSLIPPRAPPPVLRDFGAPPPLADASAADLRRSLPAPGIVSAVNWLDDTAIHYRFLYDEPTRVRRYAFNRWVAPPSEMLQARLRQLLIERDTAPAEPQLDLQLLRFEQIFDTPGHARALVGVAAHLHIGDELVAGDMFQSEVPCAPNVDGAVDGLARASAIVLAHERDWAATELSAHHPLARVAHAIIFEQMYHPNW
jgi:cholesterol transport system auxiliary component